MNRPRRLALARFVRNRGGATSIEFAMLALPFSLMLFAILESCISFAGQQMLANATDYVARQLRTGQVKAAEMSKPKLEQMICDQINILIDNNCPGLIVDLREFPSFQAAAQVKIKFTNDRDIDTTGFDVKPGPSMSKNMLRVFYKWPVMTDLMRLAMSNLKGGYTLHFATATWQNEPFND
ncbi:pilus assembly protein [Pseudaminobacter sp. 19-2017]|uniref:Pilus assembly protein n=2 Tax=Pseudaminobacter soli (ex Zhang et al. 2022) TaxID=2831468 RepID=A0A942I7R6_9HYPH|nr:pilus assembly protein [Pseudaminobacter soli]